MKQFDEEPLDPDLEGVARRLRDNRMDASAMDLDRIKVDAMRRARTPRPQGRPMRSRLAALTSAALLALGGGATFAIAQSANGGKNDGGTSAAEKQYNGKKCGNPNKPPSKPPGNPGNGDCP